MHSKGNLVLARRLKSRDNIANIGQVRKNTPGPKGYQ